MMTQYPRYPHQHHMKRLLLVFVLTGTAAVPVWADLALAKTKNCMACHTIDKKIVGPAFKDVATKYQGNKTATDTLAAKIRAGGAGVWGANAMPANTQVNEAEAKKLAAWVLSLK